MVDAVIEAAVLRLRPILMTTGAMVLGAVPLAIATGAGAAEPAGYRLGDRRRPAGRHLLHPVRHPRRLHLSQLARGWGSGRGGARQADGGRRGAAAGRVMRSGAPELPAMSVSAAVRTVSAPKHDAILDAAKRVFLREGYSASMDLVSAEAGVSKQTVYNHFASKEGLFRAIVDDLARELLDVLVERVGARGRSGTHARGLGTPLPRAAPDAFLARPAPHAGRRGAALSGSCPRDLCRRRGPGRGASSRVYLEEQSRGARSRSRPAGRRRAVLRRAARQSAASNAPQPARHAERGRDRTRAQARRSVGSCSAHAAAG